MSNDRVEAWLKGLGYFPQPEPEWVIGRKPDFFCPGAYPLWVEVKTLEPSQYSQTRDWVWNDFRSRIERFRDATGEVYAMTSETYSEAHGKVAARLVSQIAKSPPPSSMGLKEAIILPPDPLPNNAIVQIRYESTEGEVTQIGPKSISGLYGYYPSYDPRDWSQQVEVVTLVGGKPDRRQLYDVLDADRAGPVSLAYYRSATPLRLGTLMTSIGRNTTTDRIRSVIDDANEQLRSGQACVAAPGICVIYHEVSLEATGSNMFFAALFGDLTIPIALNPTKLGTPFLGRNGILSPSKNRGVSVVRYVTLGSTETIAINPYAAFPIQPDIFRAPVWVADGEALTLRQPSDGGGQH
jgi:hypothetical protein